MIEKVHAPSQVTDWQTGSPNVPGVYEVRGWHFMHPDDTAVVEVIELDGVLWCNLHVETTQRDIRGNWDHLDAFSPHFEWRRIGCVQADRIPVPAGATHIGADGCYYTLPASGADSGPAVWDGGSWRRVASWSPEAELFRLAPADAPDANRPPA